MIFLSLINLQNKSDWIFDVFNILSLFEFIFCYSLLFFKAFFPLTLTDISKCNLQANYDLCTFCYVVRITWIINISWIFALDLKLIQSDESVYFLFIRSNWVLREAFKENNLLIAKKNRISFLILSSCESAIKCILQFKVNI